MKIFPPSSPPFGTAGSLREAFSQIEVTLALAVIAFVMTAITGLLSQMAKVARASSDETLITTMIGNVADEVRSRPFDDVPRDVSGSSSSMVRYFYADGSPCPAVEDSAALEMRALYKCEITATADVETIVAPDSVSLVTVHLKFTWPLESAAPNSRLIHFDLARH